MREKQVETISHVAGHPITISGRVIQRCAVCGEKLADSKNCAMSEPDTVFPTWTPGCDIRVHGNHYEMLEDSPKLPDDSCIVLVED